MLLVMEEKVVVVTDDWTAKKLICKRVGEATEASWMS